MRLAGRSFRFYARLTVTVVLVGGLGLLLFMNRAHRAPLWFFGLTDPARPINVLWLIGATISATLMTARIGAQARGFRREFRTLREPEVVKKPVVPPEPTALK